MQSLTGARLRLRSNRWLSVILASLLICTGFIAANIPAAHAAGEVGYQDFHYGGASCNTTPTGEKPESKLWWNDGYWWGSLCNPTANRYHIYRLNISTQQWVDTGTVLDDRPASKADALWDPTTQKLYLVSHAFTTSGQTTTTSSNWGRLYRYSYNATTDTYTRDSGFPVTVTRGRSETLVIDKDSTGQLWVTYVEAGKVMVNRSLGSDTQWGEPFVLPVKPETVSVTTDDISSVVAFSGNKLGVMWSNQTTQKMYFAVHQDADADNVWQPEQTALPGPNNCTSGACADDHINLKSVQVDSSGRVYAAIKTSLSTSTAPLVMLLVRDTSGNWASHVFGRKSDKHTRPIVLLDETNARLYMFATAPETDGVIYYKSTSINNISFPLGLGDPFIKASTATLNNATSTKQNVNSTTGLVVLASDDTNLNYWHNYMSLGSGSPVPTATSTSTTPPMATATNTLTSTPLPTATQGSTPTATALPASTAIPTPTSTPATGTRIREATFESGRLIDSSTGVDITGGTVALETTSPLKGAYSARIPNVASGYMDVKFSPRDNIYGSFYLRLAALPTSDVRIALFSNAGTTIGNLILRPTGVLALRNVSTTIGSNSAPLQLGITYRVGLRQAKGEGGTNAILEGYLAEGDAAFGAPFAAMKNGTWTTAADRLRIGATTSTVLNAAVDDIKLDTASLP